MLNSRPTSKLQCICKILISLLATVSFLYTAQAYVINLDAGVENECFHERVPVGTKLGFAFEVIEGGFFDIDVEVRDPSNVIVHQDERASEGRFTIEANTEGAHHICFSNKKVSQTPKAIIFDIYKTLPDTGSHAATSNKEGDKNDETTTLKDMLERLTTATITARHDVRYLTVRDRVHRRISEATNSTVVWWAGLEFILLIAVTLGQVLYLKRFFEIRRKA